MATPTEIEAMRQAIALSALGLGTTSPNPQVGCVVLDRDGRKVGVGYHQRKGESHAEAHALAAAGARAHGGTAVVTLEPCNHAGVTPACRQALLDAEIARVVIAVIDPTSRGEGGAVALKAAGIDVEVGVLADEAQQVLEPWLAATLRQHPFVTWAYRASSGRADVLGATIVSDLRQQVDVVLHPDGHTDEGIPGGHGVGRLQLPAVPLDAADPCAFLDALFGGGARSVLVAGDSPVGRALLAADAVDRVVVDVVRDPYRPAPDDCLSVGLPDRFQIASIITTHHAIRLIGRRSMRAEG
jgi:diaminohydroxyphosphoribosylaminopyrimidine deaminase/5-amino-6-(5-phosphoribosylamino)uracil reductase